MTAIEKQQHIESIFDSQSAFERQVLEVEEPSHRQEIMQIIARSLVYDKLKSHLHFYHIKSRHMIKTEGIKKHIAHLLIDELIHYLKEYLHLTNVEIERVVKHDDTLHFIYDLSDYYYRYYHYEIFSLSADTLFEKIASMSQANRFLRECVEGSSQASSLFYMKTGGKLFYSYEQAYKKIESIIKIKREKIHLMQLEISKIMLQTQRCEDEKKLHEYNLAYKKKRQELHALEAMGLDIFDTHLQKAKKIFSDNLYAL